MADLYQEKLSSSVQITDYKHIDGNNQSRIGYTMNRILWQNVQHIPKYLAKDNSMIMIVSGSGLTRTGKSTIANQVGYAAAWCIAGGKQDEVTDQILKLPTKEVKVNTYFDTIKLTNDLSQDSEDYQVYILDEGDEAAGSRTATARKNKEFRDLIIRSAMKKMVLIIVLPDFFMLSQHWACVNSDCLINVYTFGGKRGYFNFYDRNAKERLYFYGKKKVGANRYAAVTSWPTFNGVFNLTWPGDKLEYDRSKQESLLQLNRNVRKSTTIQRDHIIKKVQKLTGLTIEQLSKEIDVPIKTIKGAIYRENIRTKQIDIQDEELIDNSNGGESDDGGEETRSTNN